MTDVEFNEKDYEEILKMMGVYFQDKKITTEQNKLIIKTKVMYEAEVEWNKDDDI